MNDQPYTFRELDEKFNDIKESIERIKKQTYRQ